MTTTSTVGAAQYPQMPYGAQPTYQAPAAAPVSGPTYMSDVYRAKMQQQQPMAQVSLAPAKKDDYSIINKTDLMLGAAGAVGGFFLAGIIGVTGPIGALILGLALLGMSAGVRGIKHMSEKKQQQQMPQAVHPGFQQAGAPPQYQNQYNTQLMPQQNQQQYAPQQPQVAPMPYQQPGMPQQPGYPQQAGYPQQNQSMWDKFLSWL